MKSNGKNRIISKQEKELSGVFSAPPFFTDKKTQNLWKEVGPFPFEKLLDDQEISVDTRLEYAEFKKPSRKY